MGCRGVYRSIPRFRAYGSSSLGSSRNCIRFMSRLLTDLDRHLTFALLAVPCTISISAGLGV